MKQQNLSIHAQTKEICWRKQYFSFLSIITKALSLEEVEEEYADKKYREKSILEVCYKIK